MNYEDIIEKILVNYPKYMNEEYDTEKLKVFFTNLGKTENRQIYHSGMKEGEFLYDLCWSVEEKGWDFEHEHFLDLVLESEKDKRWSEIATDFGKLLDSKAPIKVGICQSDNFKDTICKISNLIKKFKYKQKGERYIIFIHGYGNESGITGYKLNNNGEGV